MKANSVSPGSTLDEEFDGARQLLQLLQQEHEQLLDAEIGKLEKLSDKKAAVIIRLFELAKSRHNCLAAAGFQPEEAGMQAWIDSVSANDRHFASTKERWDELIALTRSAKELNRVNGLLIGSHMARNQSALNALQSSPDGGNIYGPNGQPSRNMPSRGLIIS